MIPWPSIRAKRGGVSKFKFVNTYKWAIKTLTPIFFLYVWRLIWFCNALYYLHASALCCLPTLLYIQVNKYKIQGCVNTIKIILFWTFHKDNALR